jgi:hypothetical protein
MKLSLSTQMRCVSIGLICRRKDHNTPMLTDVFFQVLEDASVKTVLPEPKIINIIEGEDWRAPIMAYLRHYYEPDSKNEQTRMQP